MIQILAKRTFRVEGAYGDAVFPCERVHRIWVPHGVIDDFDVVVCLCVNRATLCGGYRCDVVGDGWSGEGIVVVARVGVTSEVVC